MPRPVQPMLNRAAVVAAAVRIIDNEGLAACSLPRLAREFNVRAPSLYHHFEDRAEIMAEVARAIVRETVVPKKRNTEEWMEWFVTLALDFRRTILRHPNAAPVLLEYVPRDVLSAMYDDAAQFLTEAGIPASLHVLILDGLESLTLGAALTHAMKSTQTQSKIFPHVDRNEETALAAAVDENEWTTAHQLFGETVRSFLRGAVQLATQTAGAGHRSGG